MSEGLIVPPGGGRKIVTKAQEVTFKVTGDHSRTGSLFEVVVPPGFDVGAHVHDRSEEIFYVLEGELDLLAFEPEERTPEDWRSWRGADGSTPTRAGAGSCMFVPAGCPHAFTNPHDSPARMLFLSAPPPDHERYFEELLEILGSRGAPEEEAVMHLREKYDIQQITPLRYDARRTQ
ncbi:cupin domain-containing protein [Streptomyces marispadix]|uniref:Cupin domain-containing protein n=1 Tax=Streptomyces marispadix TaxID=2922868 RepID=A0ABS9SUJ2_9ACTN|nr:cupin domain-containing protein [Streptomyces marispadix]MCH6159940.1 cupin domain-containing protein [Streptomyces marispadix]